MTSPPAAQPRGGARARARTPSRAQRGDRGTRNRGGRRGGGSRCRRPRGRTTSDRGGAEDRRPGGRPPGGRPDVHGEGRRLPAGPARPAPVHLVPGTAPHPGPGRPDPAAVLARRTAAQRRPPPPGRRTRHSTERKGRTQHRTRPRERPPAAAGPPGARHPPARTARRPAGPVPSGDGPRPARRHRAGAAPRAPRPHSGPFADGPGPATPYGRRLSAPPAGRPALRPGARDVEPVRGSRPALLRHGPAVSAGGRRGRAPGAARGRPAAGHRAHERRGHRHLHDQGLDTGPRRDPLPVRPAGDGARAAADFLPGCTSRPSIR